MFGFSLIGPNDYAGAGTDGRLLTDPSGTTQGVQLATAGLAAYVNTFDQGQFAARRRAPLGRLLEYAGRSRRRT